MGTRGTAQHKHLIAGGYVQACINKGLDFIDKEKFIAQMMNECFCERRKALEIIQAKMQYRGFPEMKLDERIVYVIKKVDVVASNKELTTEEEGILNEKNNQ